MNHMKQRGFVWGMMYLVFMVPIFSTTALPITGANIGFDGISSDIFFNIHTGDDSVSINPLASGTSNRSMNGDFLSQTILSGTQTDQEIYVGMEQRDPTGRYAVFVAESSIETGGLVFILNNISNTQINIKPLETPLTGIQLAGDLQDPAGVYGVVPEPATLALLALGLCAIGILKRNR